MCDWNPYNETLFITNDLRGQDNVNLLNSFMK